MKKQMSTFVAALPILALAYQSASLSNCDLRAAYSKSIDWDASSKFSVTSTYDANIASLQAGTYTLASDLLTGRLFIDGSSPRNTVFDLGTSTLSLLGYKRDKLHPLNFSSSGSTFQLLSGTIHLLETHESLPANGWYMGPYPVLALPRVQESKSRNMTFVVGGGSAALLHVGEIHCQYGTNNWLVVTNGGVVAIGGTGTKIGESTGSETDDACAERAVLNGIRVVDGGVYSNANADASHNFYLFGIPGSMSNTFEVVDGGRLIGWNCFNLRASSGNVLAFRGNATRQVFGDDSGWFVSTINGLGTRLEITDGAHLEMLSGSGASNGRIWIGQSSASSSNVVAVSGIGSYLFCQSVGTYVGETSSSCNRMEITEGGFVRTSLVRLGQGGSLSEPANFNRLIVASGGVFVDNVGLVVGHGAYCSSNSLEIVSGGSVTNYDVAVGNSETAIGNAIDVSDGVLSVTRNIAFGAKGSWSRMNVRDCGRVNVVGAFVCGASDGTVSNSVVEVGSGGRLSSDRFEVYGANHTFVLSNGVVEVGRDVLLPSGNSATDGGMSLVLGGTNPVFRVEGENHRLSIRADTVVTFAVPESGYVEPVLHAPNGVVSIGDEGGLAPELRFVIPAGRSETYRCVLAEGAALEIAGDVVASARARLPENCRLHVSATKLTLTVNTKGFCVKFR